MLLDRILILNDDGIDAPGLAVAERLAAQLAREVWVVAPREDQSGTGSAISVHAPLRMERRGERRFAVGGTPSDCLLMGLRHVLRDAPPDLVLSGVNRGANFGDEVAYSGTVGGALGAFMAGLRSCALSQAFRRDPATVPWETAEEYGLLILRETLAAGWPSDACLSINFPAVPAAEVTGIAVTRLGRGTVYALDVEERQDRRGQPYYWVGGTAAGARDPDPETDVAALRRREVSVTPLGLDRTHHAVRAALGPRLNRAFAATHPD